MTAVLIESGLAKKVCSIVYINKREDKDSNADLFMKFYEDLNKDKATRNENNKRN
jgi:hypothetical protein